MYPKVTVVDLYQTVQKSGETVEQYLARFKKVRARCKGSLAEEDVVKIAVAGIRNYEVRKRLSGKAIRYFYTLYFKAVDFERVQKEESEIKRTRGRNWFGKEPDAEVGYAGYEWVEEDDVALSVDAAEVISLRDFTSKSLCKPKAPQPYVNPPNGKARNDAIPAERTYTFDITQQEAIFDHLNADGRIRFRKGYKPPTATELTGKEYCKFHCSWTHSTNACIVFRNFIQAALDRGDLQIAEPPKVEANPFPPNQPVHVVDVQLPRPHSGGSSNAIRPVWEECTECRKLADRVLTEIHQEEHVPGGQVTVMVDGEPQVWIRKQEPEQGRDGKFQRVSESIRQAVRGKRAASIKDKLTHPRRRLDLGEEDQYRRGYWNQHAAFGSSSERNSQPRMVKPPVQQDREWHRVAHPKFPYPDDSLTRTQRRRLERQRKEAREYYHSRKEYRPRREQMGKSSDEQETKSMSEDAMPSDLQDSKPKQWKRVDVGMVYVLPAQFGVIHQHKRQSDQGNVGTNELPVEVTLGKTEKIAARPLAEGIQVVEEEGLSKTINSAHLRYVVACSAIVRSGRS